MNLRLIASVFAAGLACQTASAAGQLQRADLSADTKWVLHLDVGKLQATQLGAFVARQLDAKLAKPKADLKEHLNFDFDWRRITGVTLYDTEYHAPGSPRGVLLVYTDMDARTGLEAAIEKLAATGVGDDNPIKRLEGEPSPVYAIKGDVFVAIVAGKPLLLSKSQEDLKKARQVLGGHSPNLAASAAFADFPPPSSAAVLVGAAQGFNEATPIPPQAKVLKMAEGLRLTLSEAGGNLLLNAALKAKTPEVSQQIQQLLQGMLALVALSQTENEDLKLLSQSTKVTASERTVSLDLRFPIARALEKIQEKERAKHGEPKQQ